MTRVLLTGAFGNIGTKVVDALLEKGHQVTCFDLKNKVNLKASKPYQSRVKIVWSDITDADQVKQCVETVDAVIHNAAMLPHVAVLNPSLAEKVNVGGTQNIINAIKTSEHKPQLIFPSSISVHGNHSPDDTPSRSITDAFKADDDYASHKIQCEKLLDDSGLDNWTVVRIGACLDADSKIGGEDIKIALNEMYRVHPQCRVEYVHTRDVSQALVNAIDNPDAIGKKFFLGGGKNCQTTWADFSSVGFLAMGLGKMPESAFGKDGYYTEWMDTEESQRVLQFQNHSLVDYQNEFNNKFKWVRWLNVPFRPLLKKYLLSISPYYQ